MDCVYDEMTAASHQLLTASQPGTQIWWPRAVTSCGPSGQFSFTLECDDQLEEREVDPWRGQIVALFWACSVHVPGLFIRVRGAVYI